MLRKKKTQEILDYGMCRIAMKALLGLRMVGDKGATFEVLKEGQKNKTDLTGAP